MASETAATATPAEPDSKSLEHKPVTAATVVELLRALNTKKETEEADETEYDDEDPPEPVPPPRPAPRPQPPMRSKSRSTSSTRQPLRQSAPQINTKICDCAGCVWSAPPACASAVRRNRCNICLVFILLSIGLVIMSLFLSRAVEVVGNYNEASSDPQLWDYLVKGNITVPYATRFGPDVRVWWPKGTPDPLRPPDQK